MYEFAYSEICEDSPAQNIPQPRRLSDALELIEAAQGVPSSHELLGVLSDFRRLWLMIMDDFMPGGHGAAGSLLLSVPGLAGDVLREIERCRFQKASGAALLRRTGKLPQ